MLDTPEVGTEKNIQELGCGFKIMKVECGAMGIEGMVGLLGLGLRGGRGSLRIFVGLVGGMLVIIFCPLLLLTRRIIPKPMT